MPRKNTIVSSKLNQIVIRSVADRVRSKQPLNNMMWIDIAGEISSNYYTISCAEVEKVFYKDILPFLSEYNYGVTDQSILEVIGNLPSIVENAEHEKSEIQEEAERLLPSFASTFEFHEPLMTSTQVGQEQDPLKVEPVELIPAEQTDMRTHDSIEAWMEANCASPAMLTNLFPSETPVVAGAAQEAPEKPESDSITFGGTNKTPLQEKYSEKPTNQKPWKKFEFTDTDDVSPPLVVPSDPMTAIADVAQRPNQPAKQTKETEYSAEFQEMLDTAIAKQKAGKRANRLVNVPVVRSTEKIDTDDVSPTLTVPADPMKSKADVSQRQSQPAKQTEYSAEFQEMLDTAIAKKKAAKRANRLLNASVVRSIKKAVPKKKITWQYFAHLFPESDEESVTPSPKKQQSIKPKKVKSSVAVMGIELNQAPKETVTLEAPKKQTWMDFDIADSD